MRWLEESYIWVFDAGMVSELDAVTEAIWYVVDDGGWRLNSLMTL